jgi:hypothetical protein
VSIDFIFPYLMVKIIFSFSKVAINLHEKKS